MYENENTKDSGCKCRTIGLNFKLSDVDPVAQYLKLKIIQNTVRVPGSLYVHDLGALTTYQQPNPAYGVNWNQMSDRAVRHVQPKTVAGGSFYHASSTRSTITRCRPGAGCPGGAGVDIKHNSYDRYLNRLKGKGPVRRGVVPPNFGAPLPFSPAFPIYGGKTMKTSIVGDNCICPIAAGDAGSRSIYKVLLKPPDLTFTGFNFIVGDVVYTENVSGVDAHAIIINVNNGIYTVQFDDGTTANTIYDNLKVFPCNCVKQTTLNLT
jgi:hypothetical protein